MFRFFTAQNTFRY
ncbi:hypothetical protein B4U79_02157, partial [Dinothrombium tinctorium]